MHENYKYGDKIEYLNTGNAGIVVYKTKKSILIQTKVKEFWVDASSIRKCGNKPEFKFIKIPPAEEVLSIQAQADSTISEYVRQYNITLKDQAFLKDAIIGSVLRVRLMSLRSR